jgi:hypothetical protein
MWCSSSGPEQAKHLANALAVSGITAYNKPARFFSTVDLVNLLQREKYDGKAGRIAQALLRTDLVILDELGYLPFNRHGALLHVLQPHEAPQLQRLSVTSSNGEKSGINRNRCPGLLDQFTLLSPLPRPLLSVLRDLSRCARRLYLRHHHRPSHRQSS